MWINNPSWIIKIISADKQNSNTNEESNKRND
jgi:hypothetical protein